MTTNLVGSSSFCWILELLENFPKSLLTNTLKSFIQQHTKIGLLFRFDSVLFDPFFFFFKREGCLVSSQKLGFLTGEEDKIMKNAHVDAVMILGEPFTADVYDFNNQSLTSRIHELIPIMLKRRLTPPPEESYSLHRKVGTFFKKNQVFFSSNHGSDLLFFEFM